MSATAIAASGTFVANQNHGLLVNSDGSVCSVGQNEFGELGDGTSVNQFTPVKLSEFAGASYLSSGWFHTLALRTDGTVWAWGYNGHGELGDGTVGNKPTPNQVPGLSGVIAVAAGQYHSLAAKNDGTVWGWGFNAYGQLGDGTGTERLSPVQTIIISNVIAVAAGDIHSLALKSDGTVWAWGFNGNGELGDGTTTGRTSPVQVANLSGVIAIAAGYRYSLALKSDGTVWGWGYNGRGELGDGSNASRPNIVRAGTLTGITAIAAGDGHSLAVKSDGTIWAWGNNANGELGDNTITSRNVPVQVTGLTGGVRVAAGVAHSTALRSDGSVWAWGDNTYGQLGTGNTIPSLSPVASLPCVAIPPASGRSYSSGRFKAAENFSMAVRNDGTVWSWGQNTNGQLGDGTTIDRSSPVQAASLTGITNIATGWMHSLAARSDGTVWAWGYNGNGELGDNTTVNKPTPNQIPGFTGVTAVAAGQYHSLGLKNDGTVWAWGFNAYGQLGDGTATQRLSPVQTIVISSVIAVAAGDIHSLALKSDGTVWAWGFNGNGELGDGTTTLRTSPVQVANLSGVIAIAAGYRYSLALKGDGTLWGWGYNGRGELGDGTTTGRTEIVRVSGLTDIVAIAAGDGHSMAVRSDGTVWTWGLNTDGELGDGTITQRLQPVQASAVNGLIDAVAVAAGLAHSLALKSDGTIWAWGLNSHGQFGEPLPASSTVPDLAVPAGIGGVATLTLNLAEPEGGAVFASPSSPDGVYPTGTTVCLAIAPNAGWVFSGWTGDTLDGLHCLVMDANHSVTANFLASVALRFVPVTPCRIADTRSSTAPFLGQFGVPSLVGGASREFGIPASSCNIPTTATAYSLNVTVVPQGPLGYVTIWPAGQPQAVASTLNSLDGRIKADAAIVPAGNNGAITVYATNNTDLVLDVNGYFLPVTDPSAASALQFFPLAPCRIADTRHAAAPSLTGLVSRTLGIAGVCNVPATGAQAYSLNFTVVPHQSLGFLTVYPTGVSRPVVSTLNALTGAITANAAIVPAGNGGSIDAYASNDTDLVIDVNGYFAPARTGGLSLYNLPPCRVLDTRKPSGSPPISAQTNINVTGSGCGAPATAQGFVFNATVVPPASLGYLTLWPQGGTLPTVSTLNAVDGAITSNLAIVPTTNGAVSAFPSNPTHLILDINGYFAP